MQVPWERETSPQGGDSGDIGVTRAQEQAERRAGWLASLARLPLLRGPLAFPPFCTSGARGGPAAREVWVAMRPEGGLIACLQQVSRA